MRTKMGKIRIITEETDFLGDKFDWLDSWPYIYHGYVEEKEALARAEDLLKWSGAVEVILVKDSPRKGLVNMWRKAE